MQDLFTAKFFKGNRRRLLELAGRNAPVVITANGLLQRSADTTFKFRQDSNFWYLTGIDHPDVVLVMYDGHEFLIVPARDQVHETFDGIVNTEAMVHASGIKTVLDIEAGWERLAGILKKVGAVASLTPPPAYIDGFQFYTNPARSTLIAKMKEHNSDLEVKDVRESLAHMRVVKQAPEIDAIRRAVDATVDGLLYVTQPERMAGYEYEYEVEADLSRAFRRAGCGQAFDSIVASGPRTTQMHAIENQGKLAHDAMVVLDVGAEYNWYAADVARTVMVGEPTKRQQDIYNAVCKAQDYAYSQIKPGVVHVEYEKDCARFVGEQLYRLGIIDKVDDNDAIRRHFPHMTSHFVGLEAHDVGDYKQPMQAGTVMVVEPGIYSYEEGLGVRIEDTVLITNKGCEILSRRMPRQLHI